MCIIRAQFPLRQLLLEPSSYSLEPCTYLLTLKGKVNFIELDIDF